MGLKGAALGGSGRKSGSDEAAGPDLTAGPSVQGVGGGNTVGGVLGAARSHAGHEHAAALQRRG